MFDNRDVLIKDNEFENAQAAIYNASDSFFAIPGVPQNTVTIRNNTITGSMPDSGSNTSTGITGVYGSDHVIEGNQIDAVSAGGQQEGIYLEGGDPFMTAVVNGNSITDQFIGIRSNASPSVVNSIDLTATGNRIAGNDTGIQNDSLDPVMAKNNWWGCNLGADSACGDTTAGDDVSKSPHLVLSASASPETIYSNADQSVITANLTRNSNGNQVPNGIPPTDIDFGRPTSA